MNIKEGVMKYWPWAVGGLVGIYVVSKFMGGSAATGTTGSQYAAQLSAQAAQAAQTSLGMAQINANTNAATNQANLDAAKLAASAEVAYNNSVASVASSSGTAIAQIIAAQSIMPAHAIDSALAQGQTTLQASAAVAIAGINQVAPMDAAISSSINSAIGAAVSNNSAFYNSLDTNAKAATAIHLSDNNLVTSYLNASGQSFANFSGSVPALAGAVGVSSASQVAGVSNAAAASASNQNSSMWNAAGQVGSMALWTL
jgi:hypothetical protein